MMKKTCTTILILLVLAAACYAHRPGPGTPEVFVSQLNDHLYRLDCAIGRDSVAVVASVGDDGILLVDAGYQETAEKLIAAVRELKPGADIKYVIVTHSHFDHIGAVDTLADEATVVAHRATARRMAGEYFALPSTVAKPPVDLAVDDEFTLTFNGDHIRAWHVPNVHTDGDLLIYFEESRLLCTGDAYFSKRIAFVDDGRGGCPSRYTEHVRQMSDSIAPDVTIIPGHGPTANAGEMVEHTAMLDYATALVSDGIKLGYTREKELADPGLLKWRIWDIKGTHTAYELLLPAIHRELEREGQAAISICDPLTHAIVEQGIEAAIARFHELKSTGPDRYDFGERQLNTLGYQLLFREMIPEAVAVFRLNTEVYPESSNTYDSYGESLMAAGDTVQSIVNYQKSLDLDPENYNAVTMLRQLRKK